MTRILFFFFLSLSYLSTSVQYVLVVQFFCCKSFCIGLPLLYQIFFALFCKFVYTSGSTFHIFLRVSLLLMYNLGNAFFLYDSCSTIIVIFLWLARCSTGCKIATTGFAIAKALYLLLLGLSCSLFCLYLYIYTHISSSILQWQYCCNIFFYRFLCPLFFANLSWAARLKYFLTAIKNLYTTPISCYHLYLLHHCGSMLTNGIACIVDYAFLHLVHLKSLLVQ